MNTEIRDSEEKNALERGTLYLVGTPIGNLSDMSPRALKVLAECDFIAAEDTRVSGKLTNYFGIKKPFVSYYEQNSKERGPQIIERLKDGEICALVTDAGMPAISDPGQDLVRLCHENGIKVSCAPGPTAFATALAMSGMPNRKFAFYGFISNDKSERDKTILELSELPCTVILYEAPHHLKKTLSDILSKTGDRKIALCRELTKINEEILHTTLSESVKMYEDTLPKGEFVIILEGRNENEDKDFWTDMSVNEHVLYYINLGYERNAAMKAAAKDRNVSKSEIYEKIMKKD